LLKAKQSGLSDTYVIGLYIFYNLVYALAAFPIGIVADKIGLKKMLVIGLTIFAIVYFGMAICNNIKGYILIFLLYGIYGAATEGVSKAYISNLVAKKDTATAIGFFSGFQSIFTMLASSMAGFIWYKFGASATFYTTAIATLVVILYLIITIKIDRKKEK
jgi:MFS family permease